MAAKAHGREIFLTLIYRGVPAGGWSLGLHRGVNVLGFCCSVQGAATQTLQADSAAHRITGSIWLGNYLQISEIIESIQHSETTLPCQPEDGTKC